MAPRAGLRLAPQAQEVLSRLRFPGNIRELRNVIERASAPAAGQVILPAHLPPVDGPLHSTARVPPSATTASAARDAIVPLDEAERR